MTELYIDGVSVPLPADFEMSVKHENPYFTKNGEYTYDIELSLNDPIVAKLYGFINRLNRSDTVAVNRRAVLIADNRVYIDGSEIITGWSDTKVQIQLVSGNSQLNYIVGSDKYISELDNMPVTNPCILKPEGWSPRNIPVTDKYPDTDYCTPNVYDSTNGEFINNWELVIRYNSSGNPVYFCSFVDGNPEKWAPIPYLCAYIKAIMSALGYNLVYNAIEDTGWQQLCLLHVTRSHKWNELFPQWTVKDFLEAVEQFFNARFVINKKNKEVKLVFNNQYFLSAPVAYVSQVVDEYKVECDSEDVESYDKATLQYPQSSATYGKLRSIPDVVKGHAKQAGVIGMSAEMYFSIEANRKTDTIFYFTYYARSLIFKGMADKLRPMYEFVDQFSPLKRDSSETLEMAFRPVELSHEIEYTYQNGDKFSLFFPSIGGDTLKDNLDGSSVIDLINNATDSQPSKPDLLIGFFHGFNKVPIGPLPAHAFPIVMVDKYIHSSHGESLFSEINDVLTLDYMSSKLYNNAYDIDFQNPVEFTSYDENVFDVNSIFVINNKRYVCEYIEYKIDERGRAGAWTGKFYPIKISDTETYQRWILSDGKWRDRGVWLDNGRWLDN